MCYDVDMAEDADLTEGHAPRAHADLDPPRVPRYRGGQEAHQGLPLCLVGGAGGGKRGLGGDVKFADRDLEKNGQSCLVCTAFRPNSLADRPISPLIEVHLARPNTKTSQNGHFIFGISASVGPILKRLWALLQQQKIAG